MEDDGGDWEKVPTKRQRQHGRSRGQNGAGERKDQSPPRAQFIPPPGEGASQRREPLLLLLVGLPGSGKSTFAKFLEESMPWRYVRVNQDALGSRAACEDLARRTLAAGKVAVIDRCNVDVRQRRPFLDIARECGAPAECVVFNASAEDCIRRCQRRGDGHETLRPYEAREAVQRMARQFAPPLPAPDRRSKKGESFMRVENVSSFQMVDEVAQEYLALAL